MAFLGDESYSESLKASSFNIMKPETTFKSKSSRNTKSKKTVKPKEYNHLLHYQDIDASEYEELRLKAREDTVDVIFESKNSFYPGFWVTFSNFEDRFLTKF